MTRAGCVGYNGKPKRAYATFDEALEECARHCGMVAYKCKEHGWHVGHELSRPLRDAINRSKHPRGPRA